MGSAQTLRQTLGDGHRAFKPRWKEQWFSLAAMLSSRRDHPPPFRMMRNLGPTFPAFRRNLLSTFCVHLKRFPSPSKSLTFSFHVWSATGLAPSRIPERIPYPILHVLRVCPRKAKGRSPRTEGTNQQANKQKKGDSRENGYEEKNARHSCQRREPSARKPCQQSGALTFHVSEDGSRKSKQNEGPGATHGP